MPLPSTLRLDRRRGLRAAGGRHRRAARGRRATCTGRASWSRRSTATAEIGRRTAPGSTAGGLLDTDALLDFRWQVALGGEPLTEAEMDALAEARRPLVRLRDQWVVADPKLVARAKRPPDANRSPPWTH